MREQVDVSPRLVDKSGAAFDPSPSSFFYGSEAHELESRLTRSVAAVHLGWQRMQDLAPAWGRDLRRMPL